MPHYVSLLFDVEDICWPGSDDITLDLATKLNGYGLRGSFYVVGEKARLFAERGRADVIAALEPHDLGTHTTSHSVHPTISEYLADATWDDGVFAVMEREAVGLEMLQQVFGRAPTAWMQPGGSWGPQVHTALARLNTPAVLDTRTRIGTHADLHWYAGSLVFPREALTMFDAALTNDEDFEQALESMWLRMDDRIAQGLRWTGVFVCHPTRLRAVEFWDALNFAKGVNTTPSDYQMPTLRDDAAYETALKNFDRLIESLQRERRIELSPVDELTQVFRPPGETVYMYELDQALSDFDPETDIPTHFFRFSAAELLDLVARVYTNTSYALESLHRRTVGGPTSEPPRFDPPTEAVFWQDFISACHMLVNHVSEYQHLPSSLYLRGERWAIGSFFSAAMRLWPAFRADNPPNYVEWKPGSLYPTVGHEIAMAVQEDYEHWPIHQPDLDLNELLMHTCFQCWTLRPAYE